MTLQQHFENSGNWLFRWRSFLPFLLFLLFIPALPSIHRPMGDESFQNAWEIFCFFISMAGLIIRCTVVGHAPRKTSGRNTRLQVAETLNTTGLYSLVRHPLYLGNFLIWLGIAMFSFVPWLVLCFCLFFWLYYERIMFAEEAFLQRQFGKEFVRWADTTSVFVPRFSNYKRAAYPFSIKKATRKEHTTFLGTGLAFMGMDQFESLVVNRQFSLELGWIMLGATAILSYIVIRYLKGSTEVLVD